MLSHRDRRPRRLLVELGLRATDVFRERVWAAFSSGTEHWLAGFALPAPYRVGGAGGPPVPLLQTVQRACIFSLLVSRCFLFWYPMFADRLVHRWRHVWPRPNYYAIAGGIYFNLFCCL